MRQILIAMCAFGIFGSTAVAQDQGAMTTQTPATAQTSAPADESKLKAGIDWVQRTLGTDDSKPGFYVEFGGLPPGSGISAGPGYRYEFLGGRARIDASAAIGSSRSTFAQGSFELPHLGNDHLRVGVQVKRQDFTRVSYFGIGETSPESNGADYRLQNTDYLGFAALTPGKWLTLGARFGVTPHVSIDRPKRPDDPAIGDLFTDVTAPGLSERPRFLHGDAYVDIDTRNHQTRPTRGGDYRFTYSRYSDRDYDRFSFRSFEGEAMQFIPTLKERGIIALRARVAGTDTGSDQTVPFYLLPTLGSSRSLRGYDDYRFRDRNLLLMNVEYRWRVLRLLDTAVFYDMGKVTPRFGDLDLTDLKKSYGIGLRFTSEDSTFMRLDIARSTEGTRVLFSIGDVFRPGHGSILVPYIP